MKVCLLLSNGFDSQNVQQIIYDHQLPIEISVIFTENFDNKNLKLLSTLHPNVPFLFFNQKGQLTLAKVANKEILKSLVIGKVTNLALSKLAKIANYC